MDPTTLYVLLAVSIATLVRSTFGFGEALVAVPLLAIRIPVEIAAPLAVLISITIAGVVVIQDHSQIQLRSAGWLVLATLFGLPIGLTLLTAGNEREIKAALAIVILGFSISSLFSQTFPRLKNDSRVWLLSCGFIAGVLGGAYGMNGPPLAIYGAMRRWSAQEFRATLQGYFLPASIIGMCGYWLAGLWVPAVTRYYLLSLPVVLPAIVIGGVLNRRLQTMAFLRYVHFGLACTGVLLMIQAMR